jgi:uncharacterized membrane protein YhiD involved in acid resistance
MKKTSLIIIINTIIIILLLFKDEYKNNKKTIKKNENTFLKSELLEKIHTNEKNEFKIYNKIKQKSKLKNEKFKYKEVFSKKFPKLFIIMPTKKRKKTKYEYLYKTLNSINKNLKYIDYQIDIYHGTIIFLKKR